MKFLIKVHNMVLKVKKESSKKGMENPKIENTALTEYFEIVKMEYQSERTKKSSYESRAGLFMAAITAVVVLLMEKIKIKDIIKLNEPLTLLPLIRIVAFFVVITSLFIVFINLFKILKARKYEGFATQDINDCILYGNKTDELRNIIHNYKAIIEKFRYWNNKCGEWLKYSIIGTAAFLISVTVLLLF